MSYSFDGIVVRGKLHNVLAAFDSLSMPCCIRLCRMTSNIYGIYPRLQSEVIRIDVYYSLLEDAATCLSNYLGTSLACFYHSVSGEIYQLYSAGKVIRRYSSEFGDSEKAGVDHSPSGDDLTNEAAQDLESAQKHSYLMVARLPQDPPGADAARLAQNKTLRAAMQTRIAEALDRLIQLYTETNKPDEVKRWQAEKSKLAKVVDKKN